MTGIRPRVLMLRIVAGGAHRIPWLLALRTFALLASVSAVCTATAVADPPSPSDCARVEQPSALPCGAVAVVDGEVITAAEYQHWYTVAATSGGGSVAPDPPRFTKCIAAKRRAIRRGHRGVSRKRLKGWCASEHRGFVQQAMQLLISFAWVRSESELQGVTVTASEVRAAYRDQKEVSFPKQEDYEAFLEQSGQTKADILLRVETDLLSSKLRKRTLSDVVAVSDQDVARYYNRNRKRFIVPERRDLRLVVTKRRRNAAVARARIETGERWAAVAKDLSIDKRSRSRGGRLGLLDGASERRLNRAVFTSERGQVRGPIRNRSGWYVFKVTTIKPARQLSLEQASPTITSLLRSLREQQAVDRFVEGFTKRWTARTICRTGYRTSQCANGPEPRAGH